MKQPVSSSRIAHDTAENILAAIYGEDLHGCTVSFDAVSDMVQEGIDTGTQSYKLLNEALIGALQQIETVSRPVDRDEIQSMEEEVNVLSERTDAIHQVTSKILEAWEKSKRPM